MTSPSLVDRARHLGWSPPTPPQSFRAKLKAGRRDKIALPKAAPTSDNSALCCDLDQGALGSCTANAWAQVVYMAMVLYRLAAFIPARLANYWWNRNRDGNAAEDTGASVGGAFEVGADMGIPSEVLCPYEVARFTDRPSPTVDRDAYDSKGKVGHEYFQIHETGGALLDTIERVLTSGRAVAFGIPVTEAFCSTLPSGVVQSPTSRDRIAGGHALTLVGHNHDERWFLVRNSWGDWGEPGQPHGCFRISYDYITGFASDFWFADFGGVA